MCIHILIDCSLVHSNWRVISISLAICDREEAEFSREVMVLGA